MTQPKQCGKCGTSLNEDSRFCPSCGASTEVVSGVFCSACGESNTQSSNYCDKCGTLLARPSDEALETQPSDMEPEEKQVQISSVENASPEPKPPIVQPEQPLSTASKTSWSWLHYVGFAVAGYFAAGLFFTLIFGGAIPGLVGLLSIGGAVVGVLLTMRYKRSHRAVAKPESPSVTPPPLEPEPQVEALEKPDVGLTRRGTALTSNVTEESIEPLSPDKPALPSDEPEEDKPSVLRRNYKDRYKDRYKKAVLKRTKEVEEKASAALQKHKERPFKLSEVVQKSHKNQGSIKTSVRERKEVEEKASAAFEKLKERQDKLSEVLQKRKEVEEKASAARQVKEEEERQDKPLEALRQDSVSEIIQKHKKHYKTQSIETSERKRKEVEEKASAALQKFKARHKNQGSNETRGGEDTRGR